MPTDHDKQATENREPANEMNKEDPTQGIPVWLQPFNLEDREAYVLAHSSERANSDLEGGASKVETQKTEAQRSCLLPQQTKRDLFCDQKSTVTWQEQSTKSPTKDVNLGTVTDTLTWYKFSPLSGIRVKPRLHRRRRRIYESLQKPSKKPKVIHTDNLLECSKHCEELLWNHRTTTLHKRRDKRNCRTSCTSSIRRDISRIIAIWIEWKVVVRFHGMLLLPARWPRPPGRREISKERRSGESFKGPLTSFDALIGHLSKLRVQ